MAVTFEYWSAVYAVGLDGLNDADHQELNAFAAEGWEPVLMTSVHGGFGTLVLFRRETRLSRAGTPRKAATVTKRTSAKTAKAAKKAEPAKAKRQRA